MVSHSLSILSLLHTEWARLSFPPSSSSLSLPASIPLEGNGTHRDYICDAIGTSPRRIRTSSVSRRVSFSNSDSSQSPSTTTTFITESRRCTRSTRTDGIGPESSSSSNRWWVSSFSLLSLTNSRSQQLITFSLSACALGCVEAFASKHLSDMGEEVEDFTVFTWNLSDYRRMEKKTTSPEFSCGGHKW